MGEKVTMRLKSLIDGEIKFKFEWPKKLERNLQFGIYTSSFIWKIQRNGQV